MTVAYKKIQSYLEDLNKVRKQYVNEAPALLAELYNSRRGDKRPDEFKDSSFLFIRSYNNDIGTRPFGGITFWNSPDIQISPVTTSGAYTTTLEGGQTYNLNCSVHNRGDLVVPFPKVEFFLTTPTLGFDTRFAEYLGVTQLQGLLLPGSTGAVDFLYDVPAAQSGHKCLFARTYSFSPLDKPNDLFALDPTTDRHIAQKNLNFVAQQSSYAFNLIHLPNALEEIRIVPLTTAEVLALRLPVTDTLKIVNFERGLLEEALKIEPEAAEGLHLKRGREGLVVTFRSREGATADEQAVFMKKYYEVLRLLESGKGTRRQFGEVFAAYRELHKPLRTTTFTMQIPRLGLGRGQAGAFHVVGRNRITGELRGGITLVVTGS